MADNTNTHKPSTNKKLSSQHCCVPLCTSGSRYDSSLHFHQIPRDTALKKKWIINIRRDEGPLFKITKSTVVCSKHFTQSDNKSWTPVRRLLKPGAVPTVFDWSSQKEPRRILKRNLLASRDTDIESKTAKLEEGYEFQAELFEEESTVVTEQEWSTSELMQKLKEEEEECELLKEQLEIERFGIQRFSNDNSLISFYTGFSSYLTLTAFFSCIKPATTNMQSANYACSETVSLAGRKRNMLLIDERFMFLCRLKAGLLEQDLSVRFNCSVSTVSRKIVTWANFLYIVLGSIPISLPRETIRELMPECFETLYPRTRVIIDCTEIRNQQPSSLVLNSQSFSHYKGTNTFKCLLGIAPHGAITFISSLYIGCMSDVEITKLSGLLDLLEPGDDVMAHKGFTLQKY